MHRRWSVRGGRLVAAVISVPLVSGDEHVMALRAALDKLGLHGIELLFSPSAGPPRLVTLEFEP